MGDLLDLIMNVGEVYEKYGLKGCLLIFLGIAGLLAAIYFLVTWAG